jgi:KTSC domain-containing protein
VIAMEYFTVSSSTIQSVGYDSETMTLAVSFTHGTEYHYYGVPPDVIEQLRVAPSAGRFLNEQIKKAGYSYARVR